MKKNLIDKIKVDDIVECSIFGKGKVIYINKISGEIQVKFPNNGNKIFEYSYDGTLASFDFYLIGAKPTLKKSIKI